jgi:tetratricopeptide (TPR) repeat protein
VSASDPNDQRAKEELVDVYCGLGESFRQRGNIFPAIDLGTRAVKVATELVGADPVNAHSKAQLARAYFLLGDAYQAKGIGTDRRHQTSELKEGLSSFQKGLEIYTDLRQSRSLPYSETAELSRVPRDLRRLVACRGANITRLRIWSSKRYLLNQLHSSINSVAVPHPQ